MKNENTKHEIERLEQQLKQVKARDKVLEKIESKLNQMKMIAQFASENNLSNAKSVQLNKKIQSYQSEIKELEKKLDSSLK
ncbi:hypothetical protein ACXYMX_00630 [Sporosarcina sp. CAU 1771]